MRAMYKDGLVKAWKMWLFGGKMSIVAYRYEEEG